MPLPLIPVVVMGWRRVGNDNEHASRRNGKETGLKCKLYCDKKDELSFYSSILCSLINKYANLLANPSDSHKNAIPPSSSSTLYPPIPNPSTPYDLGFPI